MAVSTLTLILMEGIKCLIAVWVGMMLCKVTIVLDAMVEEKPAKGRQLKYIKDHFRWLFGLTLAGGIVLLISIWGVFELVEFKQNYTQLWKDKAKLEREVLMLKGGIKR